MTNEEVFELVTELLAISPEDADRDGLTRAASLVAAVRSFTAHYEMRCSRRGDELQAQDRDDGGFATILNASGSARDAKAAGERDRACTAMPAFDSALASGDVSAEHVDVLAKLTKDLSADERAEIIDRQQELADDAASTSAWNFERQTKAIIRDVKARHRPGSDADELAKQQAASEVKEWTEEISGMKCALLKLDPLRFRQVKAVVDAKIKQLQQDPLNAKIPFEQLKVLAWVAVLKGDGAGGGVPEVVIHVGAGTLDDVTATDPVTEPVTDSEPASDAARHEDDHDHTLCELDDGTPIPVSTMRRFLCEAIVRAVFIEPDGSVRRMAEVRTPNRAQRRALEAIYGTCAHPDCQVPVTRCKAHHIVWYSKRGPTLLDNLVPLCEQHHHLVHEGGWGISMTPDRVITWTRPDGTIWRTHHSPNRYARPTTRAG